MKSPESSGGLLFALGPQALGSACPLKAVAKLGFQELRSQERNASVDFIPLLCTASVSSKEPQNWFLEEGGLDFLSPLGDFLLILGVLAEVHTVLQA